MKYKDFIFKVHFCGTMDESNINLIYTPKEKLFTPKATQILEETWKPKAEKGAYNGNIFNLLDAKLENNKLNIYYDFTEYKFTLVNRNADYLAEKCYVSNHIAISTIIKTKDNKIFITYQKPPHVKLVGGFWEKDRPTIGENVFKELEEETGLSKYITNLKVIGLESQNNSTGLSVMVDCSLTSNEIVEYITKNQKSIKDVHEVAKMEFIDFNKTAIETFLNRADITMGGMTTFAFLAVGKVID